MSARSIFFAVVAILNGCAVSAAPVADSGNQRDGVTAGSPWFEEQLARGRAIYDDHCASCHDSGVGGAPAIGNRADWDDRSRLWTAVLAEHAKAGFLEMPAKGGSPELTDDDVAAASEYMLTVTYPELPGD